MTTDYINLTSQLEELYLIQCSLLPDEILTFLTSDEADFWPQLVDAHAANLVEKSWDGAFFSPLSNPRFQVKLATTASLSHGNIWFEVELPRSYPRDGALPIVSVKGENISRDDQERWQATITEKLKETDGNEYIVYQLLSLHLLPILHAEIEAASPSSSSLRPQSKSTAYPHYHALFTSHHLLSPTKRRSLQQWSTSLPITGFAKVGYPGVIYAQGNKDQVDEFVSNVKAMQWLALKVRFVEPVEKSHIDAERRWVEFQKVGEVVEEMKRVGREQYILEMGIGSAGSSK